MFKIASVNVASNVATTLNTLNFDTGFERVMLGAAANHQAEFVALMRQLANATIETRKINLLDSFTSGSSSLFYRDLTDYGTFADAWRSITGANSLIVPRSVSWRPGSAAVLSFQVMFYSSNGTTAPITVGTTAGATTAEADVWVGGGTGISSINLDFGFQVVTPPDGHLYPVQCYIASQRPVLSIVTNDPTQFTTAGVNPGSISTLTATFNKIADGGVRGAARQYALTGHLAVEAVDPGDPATVRLVCHGKGGVTIS